MSISGTDYAVRVRSPRIIRAHHSRRSQRPQSTPLQRGVGCWACEFAGPTLVQDSTLSTRHRSPIRFSTVWLNLPLGPTL